MDEFQIHQMIEAAISNLRYELGREIDRLECRVADLESQLGGVEN